MEKPPGSPGAPPGQRETAPATAEDVLAVYESLLVSTRTMLSRAKQGDWDALMERESRYVIDVEELVRLERNVVFDEQQRNRKADLLELILDNDIKIRNHLLARRDELGAMIGVNRRKSSLNRTYGPADAPAAPADGSADDS
ncbi:flagellar protein FliT [Kineobactrum salinum]|uniref:Flagellar protein FliT n=1 Tax=Kineobactrum salinum TaxID=2708301 RepID=A0A6C0TWZ8_9GAMM|nr:flagellar protein FliT [Kineobactrum salinum]QIB64311.1 flagellar protein FliT [Kineobactrum salinum]